MATKNKARKTYEVSRYESFAKLCFTCKECGEDNNLDIKDKMSISSWSQDCGCCGSHGGSTMRFACSHCGADYEIDMGSW